MGELVMNELKFDWTVFVVSFSLLLGISILLVQKYVKEYPIEYEATASLSEFARDKLENVQLILHHSKRAAVVVQNFFIIGFYYNILLWYPYYFTFIGYGAYATHLSVITPLLAFAGCLAFESLIKLCPRYSHWFISGLLMVVAFC